MYRLIFLFGEIKDFVTNNLPIFLGLLVFSVFCLRAFIFLDPDFGWRLATGEIILADGIPKTDPFTYSMNSFPFVDHAWVQSSLMALIYRSFGKSILAFIYVGFAMAPLIISFFGNKKIIRKNMVISKEALGADYGVFGNFAFLLSTYILFLFFGIRAQVFSWLMLAILLNLLLKRSLWSKYKNFFPFFFMVWVNLHGSFFLGLAVTSLVLVVRSLRLRKINVHDFVVLALSFFASLVNPYGAGVWGEVWSSVTDLKLKWTIVEWMPSLTMLNLAVAILIAFSLVFVIKQRKIFVVEEVFLYFVFLLAALSSRRHLPLWAIVTLPMLIRAVNSFYLQVAKIKGGKIRFRKVYKIAWVGISIVILIQALLDFREVFFLKEDMFYPKEAVTYLKKDLPEGEIFSEYGWGGYLIWKLPEKRVFIDGRMPSWRWDSPANLETDSAFDDYNDILSGDLDYRDVFERYGVGTVLWSKPRPKGFLDNLSDKVETFFGKEEDFEFIGELEKDGWKRLYEDDVAVVYQRSS